MATTRWQAIVMANGRAHNDWAAAKTGGLVPYTLYLQVRSTRLYLPLSHHTEGGQPAYTHEAGDRTSDEVISQASWVPEL